MQPRSLDAIIAELNPTYQPQIDSFNARKAEIPGQIQAEEQGLQAKQTQAFGDILGGARQRGLGFAGIPLAEQAKYTSTEFLPALARLRQSGREQEMSLQDAILGITERRNTLAQQIRQGEITQAEAIRQFNEQMALQKQQAAAAQKAASAGSGFSPSYGGGAAASGGSGLPAGMTAKTDKLGKFQGFAFTVGNKPASAAQYAAANKIPIGDLLYQMGSAGDTTAQNAYNWIKSIQNTDLFKSGKYKSTPAYQNFSSLFWGA